MQINNNMNSSPNFGMALRIDPKAKKLLAKSDMQTLIELNKIGEMLKDHKFCHLHLNNDGDSLVTRIEYNAPEEAQVFFGDIKDIESPTSNILKYTIEKLKGNKVVSEERNLDFSLYETANRAYESLTDPETSEFMKKAKLTRYLNNECNDKQALLNATNNLLGKYGKEI